MTAKVKFEDSTALEDGARHTSGNAHRATRTTRTIKQEPASAAVAADDDLMSDDGMEAREVKNEPELERAPNAGGASDGGATRCIDCQTITAKRWCPTKRWNLEGKLCGPCYEQRLKTVPKVILPRECADCGSDGSNGSQWLSGTRWGVAWLCPLCYTYRRRHEGASRPDNIDNEPVSCANCGSSNPSLIHGWRYGRIFAVDGKLCGPCYSYHRKYRISRPPSVYVKPPRTPDLCNDCGTEITAGNRWRPGTRWGMGKLCDACYRYRLQNNGQAKPVYSDGRACASCGSTATTRWYKGARMGLQGYICFECEWKRSHPNEPPRISTRQCSDCQTTESGRWAPGSRWGLHSMLCIRCYTYRGKHDGQPRAPVSATPTAVQGVSALEGDETVPPPAKRKRTGHGKTVE